LQAFWRRSIYCASLASELAKLLPEPTQVKPGLAYLCGLLHDFGYLVLGHVFPARFFLFNRFLAVNRHLPLDVLERYVLGVEHWGIGAWLMQAWSMPEEVIAAVRWHHREDCIQPHAEYSNLVLIADRLLHYVGMGEENNNRLPALAMFTLGLTREQAMEALARVQTSMTDLDALSEVLRLPSED
jgi:HD-like signal output (HDOD) protein